MLEARKLHGHRAPAARRRRRYAGPCRRRHAYGQSLALGLGALYLLGVAASSAHLIAPWAASTGHYALWAFWLLAAWMHSPRCRREAVQPS
eukprot:12326330-Alexandrium_andersonii.AAC.1